MTSTSDTLFAVFGVCLVLKTNLFPACSVWLNTSVVSQQRPSCHRVPPTTWRRMRLLLRHLGFVLWVSLRVLAIPLSLVPPFLFLPPFRPSAAWIEAPLL